MKLLRSTLVLSVVLKLSSALGAIRCGRGCMPNHVQCITPRTYKVCINEQLFDDVQSCPGDTYCSDGDSVCAPANSTAVDFVCGTENAGLGGCAECAPNDIFTCVDRTHFTLCNNRDAYVSCGSGKMCVKELLEISELICIAPAAANKLGLGPSCTSSSTTTPAPAPVTPSLDYALAACTAAKGQGAATSSSAYFFIPNPLDSTCRTYIYCEPQGNAMQAQSMTCNNGSTYYDNAKQKCVSNFVEHCDSQPSTTSTTSTTTPNPINT